MVQQTMVEYIKSQLNLGVGKDTIKSALIGAGWVEVDVDDSFKSAEGLSAQSVSPAPVIVSGLSVGQEQKPTERVSFSAAKTIDVTKTIETGNKSEGEGKKFSFPFGLSGFSGRGGSGPGASPVVVSDLISGTKAGASSFGVVRKIEDKPKESEKTVTKQEPIKINEAGAHSKLRLSGNFITTIVLGVFTVGFAATSAWLYLQNGSLKKEVAEILGAGAGTGAQIAELNSKVDSLTSELQSAKTESQSAKTESQSLKTEFSFLAVPPGGQAKELEISGIKGTIHGGGKDQYSLTTANGAEIVVSNSKDKEVDSALKPLVDKEAEVSGKYTPGITKIEVTAVNGVAVGGGSE